MDRRDFIKRGTGLAASSTLAAQLFAQTNPSDTSSTSAVQAVPGGSATTAPSGDTRIGDMLYRMLGRTRERVSVIGLGGHHIGRQKDENDSMKIIRTAIDRGITFMDNCWDYHNGISEIRMGKALKDGYRDKVFVMTKIDGRSKEAAGKQIDECLQRLQTDRIDLMQHHEIIRMEDPDRVFAEGGANEALLTAQKAGKIRYIGFTGHKDPLVHLRMLDVAEQHKFRFDAVQMPINVMDAHFRSFAQQVMPRLVLSGVAVLGMKSMAEGMILQTKLVQPREYLQYALSMPTSVVITGIDNMEVLQQALDVIKIFKPLNHTEMTALLERTAQAAATGKYELFKTDTRFDGTALHPEWMG